MDVETTFQRAFQALGDPLISAQHYNRTNEDVLRSLQGARHRFPYSSGFSRKAFWQNLPGGDIYHTGAAADADLDLTSRLFEIR